MVSGSPEGRTSDHSLIHTDVQPFVPFSRAEFRRRFELALVQMEIPESEWDPLFERYAATSDQLRQRVYRGIYEFIESTDAEDGQPAGGPGRSGLNCRRPFVGGLPVVGEVRTPDATPCGTWSTPTSEIFDEPGASNIESLKTWLEASAPEFSVWATPVRLHLTVRPNSMSALRVNTLTIGGVHGKRPVRVNVTDLHEAGQRPVVESHRVAVRADGTVDLASALVDARFFTGLDFTQRGPKVNVRWIAGIEEAHRLRLERSFGLQYGTLQSPRTWQCELANTSPERIADIVGNDAVEDTHGINRAVIEQLRPSETPPAGVVPALAALSDAPKR